MTVFNFENDNDNEAAELMLSCNLNSNLVDYFRLKSSFEIGLHFIEFLCFSSANSKVVVYQTAWLKYFMITN